MTATETKTLLTADDERIPAATFKNSLRQWQANYQAQQPAAPVSEEAPRKTAKIIRPRRGRRPVRSR